jgi:DNA repair ATPase RecN
MITIPQIQFIVEEYFNLKPGSIQIKTRKSEIIQARQIAMYFSKKLTKSSLTSIGTQIGQKDHATVLHAIKTVNNLIDTEKKYKTDIEEIGKRLEEPTITKEEIKEAILEGLKRLNEWKNEIRQVISDAILQRFSKLISEKYKYNVKMSMMFDMDRIINEFKNLDI